MQDACIHTLRAQCQRGIVGNLVMQMTREWKGGLGGQQDCHHGEPSCCGVWPCSSLSNVQIIIMWAVHTHTQDSVVITVWTENRAVREKNTTTRAFSDSCTSPEQNITLQRSDTQMICSSGAQLQTMFSRHPVKLCLLWTEAERSCLSPVRTNCVPVEDVLLKQSVITNSH